ncbi:hypothetical protein C2S53_013408 [Perilla frutescens var. hirtella]|uniref:Uncharacterized protein n=1 Tax=Perilla frutescens var. hirtella TaxID=608512 RepID=A0AAD4J7D1_PERFH|nr:hypothetical protein C2S53_013408 [Perilla frutescens var. hirtella]
MHVISKLGLADWNYDSGINPTLDSKLMEGFDCVGCRLQCQFSHPTEGSGGIKWIRKMKKTKLEEKNGGGNGIDVKISAEALGSGAICIVEPFAAPLRRISLSSRPASSVRAIDPEAGELAV